MTHHNRIICGGVLIDYLAQQELELVKNVIYQLVEANDCGVTNVQTAKHLGLQSDYRGGQRDNLSYSISGLLLRERKIARREGSPTRHITTKLLTQTGI